MEESEANFEKFGLWIVYYNIFYKLQSMKTGELENKIK